MRRTTEPARVGEPTYGEPPGGPRSLRVPVWAAVPLALAACGGLYFAFDRATTPPPPPQLSSLQRDTALITGVASDSESRYAKIRPLLGNGLDHRNLTVDAFRAAYLGGDLALARRILRDDPTCAQGMTGIAAASGDTTMLWILVEAGVPVSRDYDHPLWKAIEGGRLDATQFLLLEGADRKERILFQMGEPKPAPTTLPPGARAASLPRFEELADRFDLRLLAAEGERSTTRWGTTISLTIEQLGRASKHPAMRALMTAEHLPPVAKPAPGGMLDALRRQDNPPAASPPAPASGPGPRR